ncbi:MULTISPECIES: aspartyl/asparaginyl beta-hydroxylase domain-containing protein [unclassified Sphingomonas]|uniref:aspartyl/asparaginyl beta-hydroxylase domain-containing protein n=1 Tax=unclassified Sphingomonas TaxID=196159 RepID=UPI0007004C26|nr:MULTISPECIES: aspartyl/asparaginyl beta-hydroxylase domain-containing protein [unclassified Sphingomonas]KQX21633.1 aspartyl beta-hydroxylase [Sphingomonas sp. Root1294]KQY72950.1 aspartyl beta-hydroxylase [Sphingomonas sp. Root50]KRB88257.1 aspartyl beta-hydroxylase [Sphingomonas sp. Root720]
MASSPQSADLQRSADAAAARGAFAEALSLLDRAARIEPGNFDLHLKRAALHRASHDPAAALEAVGAALAVSPLDFMALMLRAGLKEQLGQDDAGEAYAQALAQKPASLANPQLAAAVRRGEDVRDRWIAAKEQRLAAAMAAAEAQADGEEAARIARFRSNALRRTRAWHAEPTHFHFPGLVEREYHDRSLFPWLGELEAATDIIQAEFEAVAGAERAELVPYIQYPEGAPVAQWKALNHSRDWTAIHLWQYGRPIEANARHCPATMDLIARFPQPRIGGCSPNAMFSLLAPGTRIPPHHGVANTRLVCHLPLIVPEGCWFRVGAETRPWRRGEAWLFDDTIEHEAMNPTGALRVILIIDIWHPGLSPAERAAVTALLEAESGVVAQGL